MMLRIITHPVPITHCEIQPFKILRCLTWFYCYQMLLDMVCSFIQALIDLVIHYSFSFFFPLINIFYHISFWRIQHLFYDEMDNIFPSCSDVMLNLLVSCTVGYIFLAFVSDLWSTSANLNILT